VLIKSAPMLLPFLWTNRLALVFMAVMVLAALAIGALLAGPEPRERLTVSLVTSMRNPGLALLFAAIHAPDVPKVKIAVLAYLLLTVLLSIPFLRWQSRRLRPA
jgi:predicted Na+-dependent transporter